VIAVEPMAEMRRICARWSPESSCSTIGGGDALADSSADVIACGQSFRWFATAEALAEMARVLRPVARW